MILCLCMLVIVLAVLDSKSFWCWKNKFFMCFFYLYIKNILPPWIVCSFFKLESSTICREGNVQYFSFSKHCTFKKISQMLFLISTAPDTTRITVIFNHHPSQLHFKTFLHFPTFFLPDIVVIFDCHIYYESLGSSPSPVCQSYSTTTCENTSHFNLWVSSSNLVQMSLYTMPVTCWSCFRYVNIICNAFLCWVISVASLLSCTLDLTLCGKSRLLAISLSLGHFIRPMG